MAARSRCRTWRSIGFDLPDATAARSAEGMAWPVARVLATLQAEIDRRGAAARHLRGVVFNAEESGARVALREQLLAADYPSLATVFGEIARTYAQERIGAHKLRCILFEEDEIRLMLVNGQGAAGSVRVSGRASRQELALARNSAGLNLIR